MRRAGGILLALLVLAAVPSQAVIQLVGAMDPVEAASLSNYGIAVRNQPVDAPLVASSNPDVILVTTDGDLSPAALSSFVKDGRAAVLSNRLPVPYFEALGIRRGGIQLINLNVDPTAPKVVSFAGLSSSTIYPTRVYWQAERNPDTLYTLESLGTPFDATRTYAGNTVVAGVPLGKGYLVVIPSAALRSDDFYTRYDPGAPTPRNHAFLADAVQFAYSRSARGAASPTPAPSQAPAPAPVSTAPPAPASAPPAATPSPIPAPAATPAPSPPPARPFPTALVLAGVIIVLVAVIVGARMWKRKPPAAEAVPGVGMGKEELPPAPLTPSPPPEEPPASPS